MNSNNIPFNRATEKVLDTMSMLESYRVRYLIFGSFAIDAYEQSQFNPKMKIWIKPESENVKQLNLALSDLDFPEVALDTENKELITEGELPVDIYASINGFEPKNFEKVFANRKSITALQVNNPDRRMQLPHLCLEDLYFNVASTPTKFKQQNMNLLYQASLRFQADNPLTPPAKYLKLKEVQVKPDITQSEKPFKPVVRDFDEIRDDLDLELVLEHYNYILSKDINPNSIYRIYKPNIGGDSQRLSVMQHAGFKYKGFVDLNNTQFKGDCITFIKQMEQGDWRRIFGVIDSLLTSPELTIKANNLSPLPQVTPKQFLRDEKLIQSELIKQYQIKIVETPKQASYLIDDRALSEATIMHPALMGQILRVKTNSGKLNKDGEPILFQNIAFPLTSSDGNMISMDIRGNNYKSFPEGSKGDALWKTNLLVELLEKTILVNENGVSKELKAGSQGYLSKVGFHIGKETFAIKTGITYKNIEPHVIIISESAIDGLSFQQLNPPEIGEYRQLISPAGNPSGEQVSHITSIFEKSPNAQLVIVADGDQPGVRFAINYMGLDPHSKLQTSVKYAKENVGGKSFWYNELNLNYIREVAHKRTVAQDRKFAAQVQKFVSNLNKLVIDTEIIQIQSVSTENSAMEGSKKNRLTDTYQIRIPNDSVILSRSTEILAQMSNDINKNNRLVLLLPSADEKDLNQILQSRNGLPLAPNTPLYFKSQSL